ncbi:hypothetical protein [Hyalangium sp.]|uniref:hypothetical protein n=1 Tax=Hyalangium sp. TaxID=2028555 RepID=UPI002D35584E|nr:hypothetical protein [Hyalangium sp.]HYH98821.1 hypothetical protein [Hyalangium sp.]
MSESTVVLQEQDYGRKPDGLVWVRGPWEAIQPSRDVDEVIDQMCPAVLALPRATLKDYGQEYCGAIYTLGEGIYYASKPSPLGRYEGPGPSKSKNCYSPFHVIDPRGQPVPEADYHNHPWPASGLSENDRQLRRQYWRFRVQFDSQCTIQKLVPNLGSSRPGEVYERRGKSWVLIGIIKPEDKPYGYVTPTGNP